MEPTNSQPIKPKTPTEMISEGIKEITNKIKSLVPKNLSLPKPAVTPSNQTQNQQVFPVPAGTIPSDISQPVSYTENQTNKPSSTKGFPRKKILMIAGGFLTLMIILLIVSALLKIKLPVPNPLDSLTATPAPSPTIVSATPIPSKYATDEGVLKIETDINTLESDLVNTDLQEDVLKPRPLMWQINFK